MARVLLIDDDPSLLEVLALALDDAGHSVVTALDGAVGLQKLAAGDVELVVSDVNMPLVDGFSRVRSCASAATRCRSFFSSRDSDIDEALGLDGGADDYVSKPFSTRVLLSRVTALLRRSELRRGASASEPTLTVGGLELSPERVEVRFFGARGRRRLAGGTSSKSWKPGSRWSPRLRRAWACTPRSAITST